MQNKLSILKNITIIILIGILQISMVENHIKQTKCIKKATITGSVLINIPYCGGATPPPDIAMGNFVAYSNSVFYLVLADDTTRTPYKRFKTNQNGHFEVKVQPNKYWIFHENKMVTYQKFYTNQSSNLPRNTVSSPGDCYREWYNTPDFEFKVTKDTSLHIVFYQRCFTGINPCIQYTGPMPPR